MSLKTQTYLLLTGFLGGALFKVLEIATELEIFGWLSILCLLAIPYSCYLALKEKQRSLLWLLVIIPLNFIGVYIIYSLEAKPKMQDLSTPTKGLPN